MSECSVFSLRLELSFSANYITFHFTYHLFGTLVPHFAYTSLSPDDRKYFHIQFVFSCVGSNDMVSHSLCATHSRLSSPSLPQLNSGLRFSSSVTSIAIPMATVGDHNRRTVGAIRHQHRLCTRPVLKTTTATLPLWLPMFSTVLNRPEETYRHRHLQDWAPNQLKFCFHHYCITVSSPISSHSLLLSHRFSSFLPLLPILSHIFHPFLCSHFPYNLLLAFKTELSLRFCYFVAKMAKTQKKVQIF